jgi:hypothetical protein
MLSDRHIVNEPVNKERWWDTPRPWLTGSTLVLRRWQPPAGDEWYDHDHCAFCFAKFTENTAATLHEGYTTIDNALCICPECFGIPDLRERFQLTLAADHT